MAEFRFPALRLALAFDGPALEESSESAALVWRGALGMALRRAVCWFDLNSPCERCPLLLGCPYGRLYAPTAAGRASWPVGQPVPRPFTLYAYTEGSVQVLDFTLIGPALVLAGHLAIAAQRVAQQPGGLGRAHRQLQLRGALVEPALGDADSRQPVDLSAPVMLPTPIPWRVPAMPAQAQLRWLTPLRLEVAAHRGTRARAWVASEFDMGVFLQRLERRLRLLQTMYGEPSGAVPAERPASLPVVTGSALQDFAYQRYSARQRQAMDAGGILGALELSFGPADGLWWSALWLGQFLHAGQGTSLGFGRYVLEGVDR